MKKTVPFLIGLLIVSTLAIGLNSPLRSFYYVEQGGRLFAQSQSLGVGDREARLQEAVEHYTAALNAYPQNWQAMRQLGRVYYQLGDFDKSLEALRSFNRARPGHLLGYLETAASAEALLEAEGKIPGEFDSQPSDPNSFESLLATYTTAWSAAGFTQARLLDEAQFQLGSKNYPEAHVWYQRAYWFETYAQLRGDKVQIHSVNEINNADFKGEARDLFVQSASQPGISLPGQWTAFVHRGVLDPDWVGIRIIQNSNPDRPATLVVEPRRNDLDLVISSQSIPIYKPGTIRGQVCVKIDPMGPEVRLEVQFLDNAGKSLGIIGGGATSESGRWMGLQFDGEVPEAAAWASLRLRIFQPQQGEARVQLRTPSLAAVTGADVAEADCGD